MATGFIYVLSTVNKDYEQRDFCCVPTEWKGQLYFGPCKITMRPKMRQGDFIFGISGSNTTPRRIVFAGRIEERVTFAEAYNRFPELRGPAGPIHVLPIKPRPGLRFPRSLYEHIPDGNHEEKWEADLASRELDAFFVCENPEGCVGCWFGAAGPEVDEEIVAFLRTCSVHGRNIPAGATNTHASVNKPVVYRGPTGGELTPGLHAETDEPDVLIDLCEKLFGLEDRRIEHRSVPRHGDASGGCGQRRPKRLCP
jgi:hypothetical protein